MARHHSPYDGQVELSIYILTLTRTKGPSVSSIKEGDNGQNRTRVRSIRERAMERKDEAGWRVLDRSTAGEGGSGWLRVSRLKVAG